MKLTIFESDMGDCLLLEADSGELMLCDGGMRTSLRDQVRDALGAFRDAGRDLELVYVSHIDNDHISGILQLLEDEAEWRVFDFHQNNGDPIRTPRVPRPPVIKGILHNAFGDQIGATARDIKELENLLVAAAPSLFASAVPDLMWAADEMQGIAAGIPEGIKVSRLAAADGLDIPLNRPPGVAQAQKLLCAGQPGETFTLGSMKFTLLGPTPEELANLAKGWKTWLQKNPDDVRKIRAELKKRIDDFSNGSGTNPYDLGNWNGIPDVGGVTAPNVASLMFMVEEGRKKLLLTGDGQQDLILAGLDRTGFLKKGYVHVDVLKVQHHGSEHNLDVNFARRVSADHYVFCGNGSSGNPELDVINMIYDSRLGADENRARAPKAKDRDFHFWFSTTSQAAPQGLKRRETFEQVEARVAELEADSGGRLHLHFNQDAFIELPL